MEMSALAVMGNGNVGRHQRIFHDTGPLLISYTSVQMPVLRPRIVGIQSQPTDA